MDSQPCLEYLTRTFQQGNLYNTGYLLLNCFWPCRISTLTKPEDAILEAYITYVFDEEANKQQRNVFECLAKQWRYMVSQRDDNLNAMWMKYGWFLFGIITKSMAFYVSENKWSGTNLLINYCFHFTFISH